MIPQSEYFDKDVANADNTFGYYIIEKGDFVYNPRKSTEAPFGPVSVYEYNNTGIVSPLYLCFKPLKSINTDFYKWFFKSPAWHRYIYMSGDSGARYDRVSMRDDVFFSMPLSIPNDTEQEKISTFLSILDERIKKQQQLIDSLKLYKRGLINNLFDRKIKTTGTWKKYALSEVLTERKTYCEKDGTYEHATLSKDGVYGKTERYDRDFLISSDDKKYKITKEGDLCYNPANLKFGVICLNTYGDAIFSPIYVTFEIATKFDKHFIAACVTRNDFVNAALRFQQGTVYERMAVSPEDLLSMKIELPEMSVQKHFSNIFQKLDLLIAVHEKQFESMVAQKRTLLQQMFI